jgi:NADPH-dependent 2,4-dienoyl-CoA reductase/sulfur reductase-like enzyme
MESSYAVIGSDPDSDLDQRVPGETVTIVNGSDSDSDWDSREPRDQDEPKTTGKIVVIGAGPVGALAAIYAADRGFEVEVYELRNGNDMI